MTNIIEKQARTWLGTKFHHQGRIKKTSTHKGGVDCLGLLMGVAKELALKSRDEITPLHTLDNINYRAFPDSKFLRHQLKTHLYEIPKDKIKAGDIVLMNFDNSPQHLGIISNYPSDKSKEVGLIHSYAPAKKVIEHRLDKNWLEKIETAFSIHYSSDKFI